MKLDELHGKYECLRNELDAAYTSPVWDSDRIDQITAQMLPLERALATLEVGQAPSQRLHHHQHGT